MRRLRKILSTFFGVFLLSLFTALVFAGLTHAQQLRHPVSQLGNCRDSQECYYFCEIPRNFPACWSYGRYILHKDVLGESTKSPEETAREHGITFPIAELGNCASAQECMQYCNKPQNHAACTDFGRKKGLIQDHDTRQQVDENKVLSDAKTQLGCSSRESCMAFCNDPANREKCQEFAQNEGFTQPQNKPQPSIPSTIYSATEQELGCDSETSCMQVCNNPDNYQKCQSFAESHNLIPSSQQIQPSYPTGMITPPCNSPDSCREWCKENPDKCNSMRPQQNSNYPMPSQLVSPYPSGGTPQNYPPYNSTYPLQQSKYQPQCTDSQSCNQYCESNPGQCPGFQQNNSNYQTSGYVTPSPYQSNGSQQQTYQPTIQQPQSTPQSTSGSSQTQQAQSNPPPATGYSTTQQQQMCTSTPNCSWNGSTCICSQGQQPNH